MGFYYIVGTWLIWALMFLVLVFAFVFIRHGERKTSLKKSWRNIE